MPNFRTFTSAPRVIKSSIRTPTGSTSVTYNIDYNETMSAPVDRSTYSDPTWRIQIAKKQDASNPYTNVFQTVKVNRASCYSKGVAGVYRGYEEWTEVGHTNNIPSTYPSSDSALLNLALERLKRKLKKRVGGAKAMVPVAESRELKGLFRSATELTTGMVRTLIDIKRTRGVSALKYASQAWLTYGFGIRPLVADIQNVADAIGNYFNRSGAGIRDSSTVKKDWITRIAPQNSSPLCQGAACWAVSTLYHQLSYRYWCGGTAEVLSGEDYSLLKHLGFSGGDLIPTMWELVPYSWVVDYFTNVGAFLEDSFEVLPGTLTYAGYSKLYKVVIDTQFYWVKPVNWTMLPRGGSCHVERVEFVRTPTGVTLPHIGLRFKSMDEIGFMGVNKLLNLASVLIQRKL